MLLPNYSVILVDDECVLCNFIVRFIYRFDTHDTFRFTGFHSKTGTEIRQQFSIPMEGTESVILVNENGYFVQSTAVKKIFLSLPGFKWLGILLGIFPVKFNDKIYNWIAGNRYRIFGKLKSCKIVPGFEKKVI